MIDAQHLTKRYGKKTAVDDITFTVRPGVVTGFLGPNGSGKSTTMRLILGLDAPTGGAVTVNGKRYRDHPAPLHEVGVLLEARCDFEVRSEDRVPAGIDGEATILTAPLRFRTVPSALHVRIASRHPGASPSATRPENIWRGLRTLVFIAAGRAPGGQVA